MIGVKLKLRSQISLNSDTFKSNYAQNLASLDVCKGIAQSIASGGSEKAKQKHISRGKMLPRSRITNLLDAGAPFLEIGATAAYGMYGNESPAAGIITGVGKIHGHDIMVICNDATVKGGTYYPITVKKHLRAQEIAEQNGLPCVYLVDSGGAFLPKQDEIFPDRDDFGRIFFNQARLSALGIPQIAAVLAHDAHVVADSAHEASTERVTIHRGDRRHRQRDDATHNVHELGAEYFAVTAPVFTVA